MWPLLWKNGFQKVSRLLTLPSGLCGMHACSVCAYVPAYMFGCTSIWAADRRWHFEYFSMKGTVRSNVSLLEETSHGNDSLHLQEQLTLGCLYQSQETQLLL